jgi:urea transporter
LVSFNAALVGIALTYFFGITVYSLLFIFLGSILATLLFILCSKRNIPAYTFPFIVITWFFYWLHSSYLSPAINTLEILPPFSYNTYFTGINGFGQVVFQGNSIAGVFIFAAVLVNMPFQAVISLIVASISAILSLYFHQPLFHVLIGLYGFNVILTTLALLNRNSNTYFWASIGIILTFIIHILLLKSNLLTAVGGTLTAPFVASVWIVLLLKQLTKKITLSFQK